MNKFFLLQFFLLLYNLSVGQSYTLHFFEYLNKKGESKKDTFIVHFNKNYIVYEYSKGKPVNKIILDLKKGKQYIIWDSKKIIMYDNRINQDTTRNHINTLSLKVETDTFYFGFKSKLYCDTLLTEDHQGNAFTTIQKIIYTNNWPFNPKNYFVKINVLGFYSYPNGYPIYTYSKLLSEDGNLNEEAESSIFKIESTKRNLRFKRLKLPKSYTFKKLTYENIEATLLIK